MDFNYAELNLQQRCERAGAWVNKMEKEHKNEILESIKGSKVYRENYKFDDVKPTGNNKTIKVVSKTTTEAAREIVENVNGRKVCALNFASFKHPGGGFIRGALAQEEAICHETDLYSILHYFEPTYYFDNFNNLNRAMYLDGAIYTPNVLSFDKDEKKIAFDVLTCAAPNWGAARRSGKFTEEDLRKVIHNRIEFMYNILNEQKVDIAVLGAWGCGVFKLKAEMVAKEFESLFGMLNCSAVIFAVPKSRTTDNYYRFMEVLG